MWIRTFKTFGYLNAKICKPYTHKIMNSSLPNPQNKVERTKKLLDRQKKFQYNFNLISPLPMLDNLGLGNIPTIEWSRLVLKTASELQRNTIAVKKKNDEVAGLAPNPKNEASANDINSMEPIFEPIFDVLDKGRVDSPGNSLSEYDNIFLTIPKPEISLNGKFLKDSEFAWMRVAGSNPLVIKRWNAVDERFPITEKNYQSVMAGDTLDKARSDGRLFLADYVVLANVKAGITDGKQKHIFAPLALFALPPNASSRDLVVVAIQCGQDPVANPVIIRPDTGASESTKNAWKIAKTIVQIADANHHELISHLGLTHLLIEPFAIATARQLASEHPLSILLSPHFEGTLLINDLAQKLLIGTGQPVDELLAGTAESSQLIAAQSIQNLSFDDNLLPDTFVNRGVDSPLLEYPYRDDSLMVWNSIRQWVSDYLSIYYISENDVQNDNELQSWIGELISGGGGNIKGIGQEGKIKNRSYLIDITTQIVFTASAQHAAVNFSQSTLMSYTPAMPMAGYTAAPKDFGNVSDADFLNLLPPIKQAQGQLALTHLLGSVYYTKLGQYSTLDTANPKVEDALKKFKAKLEQVETVIIARNAVNPDKSYPYLLPSKIPQSINI
jgi:arachidonate 15-lipoxygenase